MQQGGGVAAPVGAQVLGEILPYLELVQDKQEDIEHKENVKVPEVRNLSIKDAKKILKENGLEINLNITEDDNINEEQTIIKEQVPKPGIMVQSDSKIFCDV